MPELRAIERGAAWARPASRTLVAGLLALSSAIPACRGGSDEPVELTVYAAASTRDALEAIAAEYEATHGIELVLAFGSSGDLARQILAAGKADVFLSADEREMDRVAAGGLLVEGTRAALLSNELVVVEPVDPADPDSSAFERPFTAEQLARPEIRRLALADVETVPAGRYAKEWLERRGAWAAVRERVLPAVDVRAALAAVESGAAQAGIVYRTDAGRTKRVRVVHTVPINGGDGGDEGPAISYPVAALADRPRAAEARALVDFLRGPAAGAIFREHGFAVLAPGTPATEDGVE